MISNESMVSQSEASRKRARDDEEADDEKRVWLPMKDAFSRVRATLAVVACGTHGPLAKDMTESEARHCLGLFRVDTSDVTELSELRKMVEDRMSTRCPVCMNDFVADKSWIMMLPCGHEVCPGCMTDWSIRRYGDTGDDKLCCPCCRLLFTLKHGE